MKQTIGQQLMKTKIPKSKKHMFHCTINFYMSKYLVETKCLVTYLKQANEANNFKRTKFSIIKEAHVLLDYQFLKDQICGK